MAEHTCFTVSTTAYLRSLDREDMAGEVYAVHYQKPPVEHGDGRTSFSLNFPILLVTGYLAEPKAIAEKVAAILEKHWEA